MFYERGFHATGIDDIGTAVGITGPAIYRHFSGKDDILSAAVEGAVRQILTRVDEIVANSANPSDALRNLVSNWVRATLNNPELSYIALHERRLFTPDTRQLFEKAERHHLNQWLRQFKAVRPDIPAAERRLVVYATTGMLTAVLRSPATLRRDRQELVMQTMAESALFGQRTLSRTDYPGFTPRQTPTLARSRATRREVILTVAAELFAQRGYADTGIDDIGEAAGITGPGVYRHFGGKEALLEAVIGRAIDMLLSGDSVRARATGGDPHTSFEEAVVELVEETRTNAHLARVAWDEQRNLEPDALANLLECNRIRAREWMNLLKRVRPDTANLELLTIVSGIYGMLIETTRHDVGVGEARTREVLAELILRVGLPPDHRERSATNGRGRRPTQ